MWLQPQVAFSSLKSPTMVNITFGELLAPNIRLVGRSDITTGTQNVWQAQALESGAARHEALEAYSEALTALRTLSASRGN